ncbi:MAG: PhoX family protein [Actinobacteria bacterium]|nr:PhoX family protein [Actinomycetota bacterium]
MTDTSSRPAPTGGQIDRRSFLKTSALAVGSTAMAGSLLQGLMARAALAADGRPVRAAGPTSGGYGRLRPTAPEMPVQRYPRVNWLALPDGFQYVVFGLAGDALSDHNPTPKAHDGMAAFPAGRGKVRLVRNHEVRDPLGSLPPIGDNAYDPTAPSGTTTLEIDVSREIPRLERDWVSLSGTYVNCAGGPAPDGAWVSCEETVAEGVEPHGYAFRVPSGANRPTDPTPLTHLGRFVHEAVAFDPRTGIIHLTEDSGKTSGFYRYVAPLGGDYTRPGGRLEMLAVKGRPKYATYRGQKVGRSLTVAWVPVEDPAPDNADSESVFNQGWELGGAAFARLEGAWWGNGEIYFNSTSGGEADNGQVWAYRPAGGSDGQLTLLFESPGAAVLDSPDNITVSPRGGIVLCEDGGGDQYLRGLTRDGRIFDLAVNLVDGSEWAGATFSPDGRILFVNTQGTTRGPIPAGPANIGRTYAIWGPWARGAL